METYRTDQTRGGIIESYNVKTQSLYQLCQLIRQDWKNVYFGAVPYLDAMSSLPDFKGNYYYDTAESIGLYFLANANTWRGPVAREVKKELKRRLSQK